MNYIAKSRKGKALQTLIGAALLALCGCLGRGIIEYDDDGVRIDIEKPPRSERAADADSSD